MLKNKLKRILICFTFLFIFLSPIILTHLNANNTNSFHKPNISDWDRGAGELVHYNETISECDDLQENIYYNFTSDLIDPINCSHVYDAGYLETEFKDGTWHTPDYDNITVQDLINYNNYIPGFEDFYDIVGDLSGWVDLSLDEANDALFSTFYSTEVEHYPDTFDLENDVVGTEPDYWDVTDTVDTSALVIGTLGDHRNVMELFDNDAADNVLISYVFTQTTDTIIEFWATKNDVGADTDGFFQFRETTTGAIVYVRWNEDDVDFFVLGVGWTSVKDGFVVANVFNHYKLVSDDDYNTFDMYIDGTLEGNDLGYYDDSVNGSDEIRFTTSGADFGYSFYVDAVGLARDDNYTIGDNYYWNYYPATHDLENHNITESGNYYGTDSFDYYTEPEVYYGTYDFRDDAAGWVDNSGTDCSATINAEIGDHKKVLHLDDKNNPGVAHIENSFTEQTSGTYEYWFRNKDASDTARMYMRDGGGIWDAAIYLYEENDFFRTATEGILAACADNTWYHIRIEFDCATDWHLWIDDVSIDGGGGYVFENPTIAMDTLYFFTRNTQVDTDFYIDAVGYSWDTTSHGGYGYIVGYNINPYDLEPLLYDFVSMADIGFGTSVSIDHSVGGHNNVLELYDNSNPNRFMIYNQFDSSQSYGTVEIWMRLNDTALSGLIYMYSGGTVVFAFKIAADKFQYYDGAWHDVGCAAADDTWYHVRIDFECTTNEYQDLPRNSWHVFIDGVNYGDYNFDNDVSTITQIRINTNPTEIDYYYYLDAIGYSWDPDYCSNETTWNFENDFKSWNKNPYDITNLFQDNWDYYGRLFGEYSVDGLFSNHKKYLELYDDSNTDYFRGTDSFDYGTAPEWYYATWDFTDEVVGTSGASIVFVDTIANGLCEIISDMDDHNRVLEITNNAGNWGLVHNTFSIQTGINQIEFWWRLDDSVNGRMGFNVYSDDPTQIIRIYSIGNTLHYRDGAGVQQNIFVGLADDTWYHTKIELDVDTDTWSYWHDGNELVSDVVFYNTATVANIERITIGGYGVAAEIAYYDAVGYSWDTTSHGGLGYTASYNVNPYYLESLLEVGYDLEIGWNTSINVESDVGSHDGVLNITDYSDAERIVFRDIITPIVSGTIEFWIRSSDPTFLLTLILTNAVGSSSGVQILWDDDKFRVRNGGIYETVLDPMLANTWYHYRVDFECSGEGYMGLAEDTFYLYIDGVRYGPYAYRNVKSSIGVVKFQTDAVDSTYSYYIDAFSYSWDDNYIADLQGSDNSVDIGLQVWNTFEENQTDGYLSFWTNGNFDYYFRIYLMQDNDFVTSIKFNTSFLYYLDNRSWVKDIGIANAWHYVRIYFNTTSDTYDLWVDYSDYTYCGDGINFNMTLIDSDIPFQQAVSGIDRIMFETICDGYTKVYKVDALQYSWDANCSEYWDFGTNRWDLTIDANTDITIETSAAGYYNVLNMTDDGVGGLSPELHRHFDNVTEGSVEFEMYLNATEWDDSDCFAMELWQGATSREFSVQFYGGVISTFWNPTGTIFRTGAWITVNVTWNATSYDLYVNGSLIETGALLVGLPINIIHFEMMYCQDGEEVYLDNITASFWYDCSLKYNLIPTTYAEFDVKISLNVGADTTYIAACLYWAFLTESDEYVNFTWYNFDTNEWDVIIRDYFDDDVPPVGFTEFSNCSGCFNYTFIDPYVNSSGDMLFRFKILDFNDEFEIYFDELRLYLIDYVNPTNEKVFCWKGIWRYRWFLRINNGTWMWSDWTYFEVIPLFGCANFEGVSESPYSTYWKLMGSGTNVVERFSDDFSAGTWYLDGVGSETFEKEVYESDNYLLNNYTLSSNFGYSGIYWDTSGETISSYDIIWDGTFFWIVDLYDSEVYKYTAGGVYTDVHWDTSGESDVPSGITWDGTFFWVVDLYDSEVYKYTAGGVYTDVHWDTSGESNDSSNIIWDGTFFWVVDLYDSEVYKYTAGGVYTDVHWDTGGGSDDPVGITWDGTFFWIVDLYDSEVYKYTYNRIISKYYHRGSLIYMQTNITETLNLRNLPYGADVDVFEGDYMYFYVNSTTENVKVKFYLDGVEQVEYTLLQNNVNSNNQTVLVNIDSDFTFDALEFIGLSMSDMEYFVCYGYEIYSYTSSERVYDMYVDPDGKDDLMCQFGDYKLEIYERDGGSFSLQVEMNITLNEVLLTVIYVPARVWYLKIYHYAHELSDIEITGVENRSYTAGRDEILEIRLKEGDYMVNWTNGETGKSTTHAVALYSDQSLIFETTYYDVYFSLYDQYNRRLDDTLFTFYLNGSRKDFGFVELHSSDYNITVYDYLSVSVFDETVTLETCTEYNIYITVFELQIRHLARENGNITLFETTTHNHVNFSMAPDSLRSFILANSTYNITWVNGENSVSTFYNITLDVDYILTLDTVYYDVYFSLFNFDGLGLEPHLFRFYINGLRRDFGFNTLKQNTNSLKVLDYFNQTLFSSAMNLRGFTEYSINIEVWTMIFCNNYSFPVKMKIERNEIEVEQVIDAGLNFPYRMLPGVEYFIQIYHLNGTLLETKDIELDENNQVVSFGFFEIEVPYDPEPLIFDFTVLMAFVVIICIGGWIVVISWSYMKNDRDIVPKDTRMRHKRAKKRSDMFDHGI